MYKIRISKKQLNFIKSQNNSKIILSKLKLLKYFKIEYVNLDIKKLKGKFVGFWRVRIGELRAIFIGFGFGCSSPTSSEDPIPEDPIPTTDTTYLSLLDTLQKELIGTKDSVYSNITTADGSLPDTIDDGTIRDINDTLKATISIYLDTFYSQDIDSLRQTYIDSELFKTDTFKNIRTLYDTIRDAPFIDTSVYIGNMGGDTVKINLEEILDSVLNFAIDKNDAPTQNHSADNSYFASDAEHFVVNNEWGYPIEEFTPNDSTITFDRGADDIDSFFLLKFGSTEDPEGDSYTRYIQFTEKDNPDIVYWQKEITDPNLTEYRLTSDEYNELDIALVPAGLTRDSDIYIKARDSPYGKESISSKINYQED